MTPDDPDGALGSLPLDRYRAPAMSYAVATDGPVVAGTNDAFDAAFGTVPAGTPLSDVFEGVTVHSLDASRPFPACLLAGDDGTDRLVVEGDSGTRDRYVAQVVPPADDAPGYVLFVESAPSGPGEGRSSVGIDRVASAISHDLRNPLDVAKARLRAGRETGADEHFAHVAQAHDRMERIIEDVLTLAHGEDVVTPTDAVDLERAAESAWETVDTEGATVTLEDSLPTVVADGGRVGRLFENLFRNAVEHSSTSRSGSTTDPEDAVEHSSTSPGSQARQDAVEHGSTSPDSHPRRDAVEHGGETPTVTVGAIDGDGFYVADDGPGIPEAHREAVFEPGFTVGEGGTGLGLAIVDRIVAAHGWSVAVTEAESGGARFEITGVESTSEGGG